MNLTFLLDKLFTKVRVTPQKSNYQIVKVGRQATSTSIALAGHVISHTSSFLLPATIPGTTAHRTYLEKYVRRTK